MTLTYRLVKGSALTFAEADGNISTLDGRLTAVEGATAANPIDSITVAGNVLTFHYTTAAGGGSESVTIPTASWNGRGDWQPSISYAVNDLVIAESNLYLVKIAHTSDLTFDAGRQIGGQDVYDFLFGPMGQTESADLNVSTYTLQGTDDLKFYRATATGGCTITVPDSSSVAIPLDSEISFRQCAGQMIFDWSTPVAVNVPDGFDARTNYVGSVITLKKVAIDEWDIFGALVQLTA